MHRFLCQPTGSHKCTSNTSCDLAVLQLYLDIHGHVLKEGKREAFLQFLSKQCDTQWCQTKITNDGKCFVSVANCSNVKNDQISVFYATTTLENAPIVCHLYI